MSTDVISFKAHLPPLSPHTHPPESMHCLQSAGGELAAPLQLQPLTFLDILPAPDERNIVKKCCKFFSVFFKICLKIITLIYSNSIFSV